MSRHKSHEEDVERLDSVEVRINAKGQLSATVKVYAFKAEEAAEKAQELALKMKEWCKVN